MKILNYETPYPSHNNCNSKFVAVLTQDDAGLYAAYAGVIRDWANDKQRDDRLYWVAHSGRKLTLRAARAYFPYLTEQEYRA